MSRGQREGQGEWPCRPARPRPPVTLPRDTSRGLDVRGANNAGPSLPRAAEDTATLLGQRREGPRSVSSAGHVPTTLVCPEAAAHYGGQGEARAARSWLQGK